MLNFEYMNPTKIIFGKGQIAKLPNELPKGAKVMLLYGGGSIKTNGIYEQVKQALQGFDVIEFSGIPANPEYEILMEALKIIKTDRLHLCWRLAVDPLSMALNSSLQQHYMKVKSLGIF